MKTPEETQSFDYRNQLAYHPLIAEGFNDIENLKPKPKQRVYVICEGRYEGGHQKGEPYYFQTIAEYIPYKTVPADEYMNDDYWDESGDYDEEQDQYFTPEGFYEWQSEPDINWKLSYRVVMWKPLYQLKKLKP